MDKFVEMLSDRLGRLVAVPFIAQLALALADGKVSPDELHKLTDGARWMELAVLGVVLAVLQYKKAKK